MAEVIKRPVSTVDWGTVSNQGTGNILGDDNVNTIKWYKENSGSVLVFPKFTEADLPFSDIIAVGVGYRQVNGGLLGLYDGWVRGFLSVDGEREPATLAYTQDRYSTTGRNMRGPAFFKPGGEVFTADDLNRLSMDVGAAVGAIGPKKGRYWCGCGEAYLVLYTVEDPRVPTLSSPGSSQTVNTASVSFSARLNTPDYLQTQAIFQVARNSSFTEDLREYEGDFFDPNDTTKTSNYSSVFNRPSYTGLGPGTWYYRAKSRDYRGAESAWTSARSFTVTLPALPGSIPNLTSSTVKTPYGIRSAFMGTVPDLHGGKQPVVGERKAGVRWQYSKTKDFASVVEWANVDDGSNFYGEISYNAQPDASVPPGGKGAKVSFDDPSQYLSQGTWYVRTRTEDVFGLTSAWFPENGHQITVAHPPTASNLVPVGGTVAFDPEAMDFTWDFMDPWADDEQSEYEIIVRNSSSNQIVWRSGAVASSLRRVRADIPISNLGQSLNWRVRVKDLDGAQSGWPATQPFVYRQVPKVTIISPSDVVNTGRPLLSWSAIFNPTSVTQRSYRVTVSDLADRSIAYDSGVVNSTETQVTPTEPILRDGHQYRVTFHITDTNNLTGTVSKDITAQFVRPPAVPVIMDSTDYEETGYVVARWRQQPDAFFSQWRLYRRHKGQSQWTLAATSNDRNARSLNDWLVSGSGVIEYYLAQEVTRYGSLIESQEQRPLPTVSLSYSTYLLAVPSIGFSMVVKPTADSFTITHESEVIRIMGRGDKVNFGTARGREGSLKVQLRNPSTAVEIRRTIDKLIGSVEQVWLRDPFGDAFMVALSEYSFERLAGVGPSDLGDLEIPYVEVVE